MMLHAVNLHHFDGGPHMRIELTIVGDDASLARLGGSDLAAAIRPHLEAALEQLIVEVSSRYRGSPAYARAIERGNAHATGDDAET